MVPINYLAQFVLDKCSLLSGRIFLVPPQHLMDTTVDFVELHLLSLKQSGYSRRKSSSGYYLKTCLVIIIKVENHSKDNK